eukprot:COSAG02_NODE_64889_length_259_cov_0.743750_1_plen_60_part_10
MAGRGDDGVVQLLEGGLPVRVRQLRLPSRGITAIGAAAIGYVLRENSVRCCGVGSRGLST